MKKLGLLVAILAALATLAGIIAPTSAPLSPSGLQGEVQAAPVGAPGNRVEARQLADVAALETFRPGYAFWQHVFTIPDGSVVFGSAADGRRLAVFPTNGDWTRSAEWNDRAMAAILDGHKLPRSSDDRREYVARLLEQAAGPVQHNATRGEFLRPGLEQYANVLQEWGSIYERFGVPGELGLAQALVESGFIGNRRSEAGAVGLCQWLERNWDVLDAIDPAVLEIANQTTQAAYCAAYISALATKYDSFIPAFSEHHAGGTNVGRILVNGERLGGDDPRERYFLGSQFARDLRTIAHDAYGDIYESYGPRSYRYAEMVFGNTSIIEDAIARTPQRRIHAMRTTRPVSLSEITRRTGLSVEEVRRLNPALIRRVPAGATIYLPEYDQSFGRDVSYWHRPAGAAFESVLKEFLQLDASPEEWDRPSFAATLREFEQRFRATDSEEGTVMATVLAYLRQEASAARRQILADFRSDRAVLTLFARGVQERGAVRMATP